MKLTFRYALSFSTVILVTVLFTTGLSEAQSIDLEYENVLLSAVLSDLSIEYGIDFIYALRLVEDEVVSCIYVGVSIEEALSCLLNGTKLSARRLHDRQYILAPDPDKKTQESVPIENVPTFHITGVVNDKATDRSLPGAHIYLPEIRRGTISDSNGFFSIDSLSDSTYEARISYLGYRASDNLLRMNQNPVTVYLEPVTLETNTILVEANIEEEGSYTSIPGLISMRGEQLENSNHFGGENDLLQTLQWNPGVHKAGLFNNGLLVRGGFSDQNLYLIDGVPVYHPWHAFNLISTFNTDAFEDIKFYKGTFPAQHGGRLSSVLDARLKDGSRSGPTASVGMSVLSGRFLIESPVTKKSSFMISGRRSYIDKLIGSEHPVQDASGARDTLRTGYHFSDITTKVSYRPNETNILSATYYSGSDILDLRLPFNLSLDFNSWLRPAELFFEVDHNWGNRLYTLQHKFLPSRQVLLTSTLYRSSYNAYEGGFVQPTSSSNLRSQYHVRVRDVGFRTDLDYVLSERHHIQSGFLLVDHQFDSSIDATIRRSEGAQDSLIQQSSLRALESSAYLQHTWNISSSWSIQPGIRLSYFSSGDHVFLAPRFNVQYVFHPQYLILKGSAGSQVQFIQRLRDRYSFIYDLISSRWIPTSENIKPSRNLQIALEGKSRPFSWLKLNVETYLRSSKNVLLPRDVYQQKEGIDGPGIEISTLLSQYSAGLSRAFGAEFISTITFKSWKLLLSYAGSRSLSKVPSVDDQSYHPTLFDVPRLFRSSLTRTLSGWHFTVSSIIRSGYPLTLPVAAYSLSGPGDAKPSRYLYRPDYNNGRLPPYMRFDFTIGYHFDLLGAQWSTELHIFNLTNRRNIIDRYYEPTIPDITVTDRKGLPILPLFEIEMTL